MLAVALANCHAVGQKITRLDPVSRPPDQAIAKFGRQDAQSAPRAG